MGKVKRITLTSLIAIGALSIFWLGLIAFSSLEQGCDWDEMDWNQDGSTSIFEFFRSADIRKRKIEKEGGECVEYYRLKDGLPETVVCFREN